MMTLTIRRAALVGTTRRPCTSAGHEATHPKRDGGDATGAEVVLLAVPYRPRRTPTCSSAVAAGPSWPEP
jgi:hypothetical protein